MQASRNSESPLSPVPGVIPEPARPRPPGDAPGVGRGAARRDAARLRDLSRKAAGRRSPVDPRTAGRGTPASSRPRGR